MNGPIRTMHGRGTVYAAALQRSYTCNSVKLSVLTMREVRGSAHAITLQSIATFLASSAAPASLATSQSFAQFLDTLVPAVGDVHDLDNLDHEAPERREVTVYVYQRAHVWYIIVVPAWNVLARHVRGVLSPLSGPVLPTNINIRCRVLMLLHNCFLPTTDNSGMVRYSIVQDTM